MGRAFAVKTVHKQMYPATYNFKDEADGTSGLDIDFVDTAQDGAEVTIIAVSGVHRKVLQNADTDGSNQIKNYIGTSHTSGDVEFWYKSNDVTARTNIHLHDSSIPSNIIYLRMDASELKYYIGLVMTATGLTMVNNTWYHIRLTWYADDTYDYWIDGVQYADGVACNTSMTSGIDQFFLTTYVHTDYLDAVGYSWDTDYTIGDNVFWRHFKESTDSFEGDDVGTQGTSITWVDIVDTAASFEIVPEFNEHKKILRGYYSSGAGGEDTCYHSFASQAKTGWFEGWIKTSDATIENRLTLNEDATVIIAFRITTDKFQIYTAGAFRDVTGAPVPVDATWYHIYIRWYDAATDTFDLWIDNILYEDGTNCVANQTAGINRCYISGHSATEYVYIDAPMSSLDSDERADNRTFDYNDTYTKTDITTDIKNVNYGNKIYSWRTATLYAKSSYEFTNVFFEIYDINSKLAMRGEIKNRILEKRIYRYPLRDMNWDDLNEAITNVFTTDKIHDPTDSTSMLKTALPNVDQTEGDLILADADMEAATYSPTLRFYPTHMFLRDISDLADSVTIIKASGIVLLDDDLASGDTLDIDVAVDKRKMAGEPIPTDILETINYFEILGAMNTDTGQRFYKLIDNSGDDKKRKWRYVNNGFKSQADVDAYAAILSARITTVKIIRFSVQNLGAHDMGTTLNYKYIKGVINIAQANYYIISETIDFDANLATIVLSEGLIEESKYSAAFERPENYVNSYASEIYETDLVTTYPDMKYDFADEVGGNIRLDAVNELVVIKWFMEPEVDDSRDITLRFCWQRGDANNDTIDITRYLASYPVDGATAPTVIWNSVADTLDAGGMGSTQDKLFTIDNADINPGELYQMKLTMTEPGRLIYMFTCALKYYMKREV